jgi:hypothetical protein
VRAPDKDDWGKLSHLVKYIRGTRRMPLILRADGSGILKWYVDAAFAVHPNLRGHSGGGLTLGQGMPIVSSTKQKLNTRSSTETEVVGADDFMPAICWTRYFLKAQGYDVKANILFQDNKSSILLEKNGKASSSKRTKHINIRFFFISDRVSQGELSVLWCPTGDMVGDYATKPLQGALFKKFRDQIMGVVPIRDPGPGKPKPVLAKVQGKKPIRKSTSRSAGLHKATKMAACVPPQHTLCALKKRGTTKEGGRAGTATLTKAWKGRGATTHGKVNTQGKEQSLVPSHSRRDHRSVLGNVKREGACAGSARNNDAKAK